MPLDALFGSANMFSVAKLWSREAALTCMLATDPLLLGGLTSTVAADPVCGLYSAWHRLGCLLHLSLQNSEVLLRKCLLYVGLAGIHLYREGSLIISSLVSPRTKGKAG